MSTRRCSIGNCFRPLRKRVACASLTIAAFSEGLTSFSFWSGTRTDELGDVHKPRRLREAARRLLQGAFGTALFEFPGLM